jgi:hypothetical protein
MSSPVTVIGVTSITHPAASCSSPIWTAVPPGRIGYSVSSRALFGLCDISRMLQVSLLVEDTRSLLWGPSALVASYDLFSDD